MGYKEWFNRNTLLVILLLAALAIGLVIVASLLYSGKESTSPVLPLSPLEMQAVENEGFDNLDGDGEIKWYENFFTWNPTAQATSYPFITGTTHIDWQDEQATIELVSLPDVTAYLVVELELRGNEIYTQAINTEIFAPTSPGIGNFYNPQWVWIDIQPGDYEEWIKSCWQVSDGSEVCTYLIDNGEIVEPDEKGFVLYRVVTIPHIIYLPMVMKRAQ